MSSISPSLKKPGTFNRYNILLYFIYILLIATSSFVVEMVLLIIASLVLVVLVLVFIFVFVIFYFFIKKRKIANIRSQVMREISQSHDNPHNEGTQVICAVQLYFISCTLT